MKHSKTKPILDFGIGPLIFRAYTNDDNIITRASIDLGPYGSDMDEFKGVKCDAKFTEKMVKEGYEKILQYQQDYIKSAMKIFGVNLSEK